MCIPYPPPLQTSVGFISVVFVNFANHRQRDYKWFKITSNTIDKRATIRDKIIAKLSLASLLLRGPQCWCKHSFSLLSLSNVIIIHMSLLALNKYDWQNFIQQGITRKVKKYRGDTHISAPGQWYVYPFLRAPLYSTFACCLIPVLTLVVSLVMLDDIDDISFSKRRYFLIVSWMSISVYCIPTRDTHITRDMCMGIHISRGYTYHCDTGFPVSEYNRSYIMFLLPSNSPDCFK